MLALDVVNVLATISSVCLIFSPFPDFRRIHTHQCTGEVRVLPVLMLCVNCFTWAAYGFLSEAYFPVMAINALGTVVSLAFSVVFYRWSSDRTTLHQMGVAVALWIALVLLFVVLCRADVLPIAANVQEKMVGYLAVAINVCLYASPLQTMKLVLRTKSSASLPVTMCCVNLVNGSLWVLYGILADDMFVLSPNALGVALSLVQVALCLKFRHDVVPQDVVMSSKCDAVILSPVVDGVAIDVVKSSVVYEAVQSPV